jgi:cation transport regulator ChaB
MYKNKSDLPESLQDYLTEELQEIYLEAYQQSWENYEEHKGGELDREGVAHRDAMVAVTKDHTFDEDTGKWYRKGEEPSEEEDQGLLDNVKDFVEHL